MYPLLLQFRIANNYLGCIAGRKKRSRDGLSHREGMLGGVVYDEDNKLDTQYPVIVYTTNPKQNMSVSDYSKHSCMRVDMNETTESKWRYQNNKKLSKHLSTNIKTSSSQLRDLTAYASCMRGRSFHSMSTARLAEQKENRNLNLVFPPRATRGGDHKDQVLKENFHT